MEAEVWRPDDSPVQANGPPAVDRSLGRMMTVERERLLSSRIGSLLQGR
jgi:hypothetical protein